MKLPSPETAAGGPLHALLNARRTVRDYDAAAALTINQASQLLWAAQGITGGDGYRTAPSAAALFPFEVFLVAGSVDSLEPGVYRYDPGEHAVTPTVAGDRRAGVVMRRLGVLGLVMLGMSTLAACDLNALLGVGGEGRIADPRVRPGSGMQKEDIMAIQQALADLGYAPGPVDGIADHQRRCFPVRFSYRIGCHRRQRDSESPSRPEETSLS